MKKIPTLFRRDPDHMSRVLPEVSPGCEWVLDGEGVATRKYDGTCVMHADDGTWWARREVKPGRSEPPGFRKEEVDETTGKTVGWEPIEQSPFIKAFRQAAEPLSDCPAGTYELCGPKVNGNPEKFERHTLVKHSDAMQDGTPMRDYDYIRDNVLANWYAFGWEGLVWHHPDGRMAKVKARDFR